VYDDGPEFRSLYLMKFASSFGVVTLVTLLPTYIDLLDPSGIEIGLFIAGLGIARTVGVVPLAWAGDRYDKRALLLASLVVSVGAYLLFPFVASSLGFVAVRVLQGFGVLGTGLLSLAIVGELASAGTRANYIGKLNSFRFVAGIAGTLGAGALYDAYGFTPVFGLLAGLLAVATVAVWRSVEPDGNSVEGFAFADLAINRRILTVSAFRAQYAVAVILVRRWVPILVGVSAARGGLGLSAFVVGVVIAAEKFTNMLLQPHTGRLSDRYGRLLFVAVGGTAYGLTALAIPLAPAVGARLGLATDLPLVGAVPAALPVLVALNAALGVADSVREPASMALYADEGAGAGIASSIGIRSIVWRPGALAAPVLGGWLMTTVGMDVVFLLGGAAAITGALTLVGVRSYTHGPPTRRGWWS
jgi:MFS family permease